MEAVIAVITVLGALGGVWLGHFLAAREQRKERLAAEAARWRETAATAIGKTMLTLLIAYPETLLEPFAPGDEEAASDRIQALAQDWVVAREHLSTLEVGHPSGRIRELTNRLLAETQVAVSAAGGLLSEKGQGHQPSDESIQQAVANWNRASRLGSEIRDALHEVDLD